MKNVFYLLLIFSFVFVSCKKDDPAEEACAAFIKLSTKATVNGVSQSLSVAQFAAVSDLYTFQIGTISDDCSEQSVLQLNLMNTAASITGTYPIKDFADADNKEASGSFSNVKSLPPSSSTEELTSGTLKITDHGASEYTIDLSAKTKTGKDITVKTRHKF